MASVFLVRHGEVAGNSGERLFFSGWQDVTLTPRGEQQAQAVSRRLASEKIDVIYSSDLQRAWRTAEQIATLHGLRVRRDAAWRESNFGAWGGHSESEILEGWPELWRERQSDPVNVRPPDGESLQDLMNRVQPAWQKIVGAHEHDNVVIVAHQGTVRMLLCAILEIPPVNYRRLRIANCSVTRVELAAGKALVTAVNDTHHLLDI
jgi:alpha-ribazole phosphatase